MRTWQNGECLASSAISVLFASSPRLIANPGMLTLSESMKGIGTTLPCTKWSAVWTRVCHPRITWLFVGTVLWRLDRAIAEYWQPTLGWQFLEVFGPEMQVIQQVTSPSWMQQ